MTTTDINGYTPPAKLTPATLAAYGANLTNRVGGNPDTTQRLVQQLEHDALANALNATGYVLDAADDAQQELFDQLIAAVQAIPSTMRMVNRDTVVDVIRRLRPHPRIKTR